MEGTFGTCLLIITLSLLSGVDAAARYIVHEDQNVTLYDAPCGCVISLSSGESFTLEPDYRCSSTLTNFTFGDHRFDCPCGCSGEIINDDGTDKFECPKTPNCPYANYARLEGNYILCGCACGGPFTSAKKSKLTLKPSPKCAFKYRD